MSQHIVESCPWWTKIERHLWIAVVIAAWLGFARVALWLGSIG